MYRLLLALVKGTLLVLLIGTVVATPAAAQTPVPYASSSMHQAPAYRDPRPGILITRMWGWTTDAWDADDKPYQTVRNEIGQAVAAHRNLDKLLVQYRAQWQKKPDDPLALFRWACLAYQVMLNSDTSAAEHQALDGLMEAYYHTPAGHTYNFARMQFLTYEFYTSHREAVPIAERLLAVEKNDYQVEYDLASIYLNDYVPAKVEDALTICNHLKQTYPTKSSLYALTGFTYVLWWYKDKQPDRARLVVENYQKYLRLASPKDEFRKRAQGIIDEFKSKMS